MCFCLDISGSGLASPLCLTLFLWSSDLVLVQCYLLCSLYLVVFCLFVLVLVCMSVVFVVLSCCHLASSLLVAVSPRQVVSVCFSLSSCDPLGFVNRVWLY